MISVVVIARNEERAIGYVLRSVRTWADEIVVVDQQSEDDTAAIARSLGARVAQPAAIPSATSRRPPRLTDSAIARQRATDWGVAAALAAGTADTAAGNAAAEVAGA